MVLRDVRRCEVEDVGIIERGFLQFLVVGAEMRWWLMVGVVERRRGRRIGGVIGRHRHGYSCC
jgi:hypothetical protein